VNVNKPIKALSVIQPWAELIISGKKTVELRTWLSEYRGELWLHTGKRGDDGLENEFGLSGLFRGGFIGVVELSAIVSIDPHRWESWRHRHRDPGPWQPGMFAWIIKSPRRFITPIPAPGALGLFSPSTEVQDRLRRAAITARRPNTY
jgi:ASCH domain